MSHNTFGHLFRFTTWGESHGPAIGCVVDGCPPGLEMSEAVLQPWLDRRRPGGSRFTTHAGPLPPTGHLTLMLREWTPAGYVTRDYRTLARPSADERSRALAGLGVGWVATELDAGPAPEVAGTVLHEGETLRVVRLGEVTAQEPATTFERTAMALNGTMRMPRDSMPFTQRAMRSMPCAVCRASLRIARSSVPTSRCSS